MPASRPSTHPAEQYRRAREALTPQLADVLYLLAQLDADETFVAGDELLELLADVADRVNDAIAARPLPPSRAYTVADVDTGGRI